MTSKAEPKTSDEDTATAINSKQKDVAWREYDIHDSDEDVDQEEHNAFDLFGREEPLQSKEFAFPGLPAIQLQCQEDYTQSTGMAIWLGADFLTEYIINNGGKEMLQGKKVLEVGAGVGLCGIVAHHLGASQVVLTDGDLDALNNLRHNVQHNTDTTKCTCHQLVWGKNVEEFKQEHGQFDVVIGADLFYMTRSIKPLFQTVDQLLAKEGIFLASSPSAKQNSFDEILEVIATEGFIWTTKAEDVFVFKRKVTSSSQEQQPQD